MGRFLPDPSFVDDMLRVYAWHRGVLTTCKLCVHGDEGDAIQQACSKGVHEEMRRRLRQQEGNATANCPSFP